MEKLTLEKAKEINGTMVTEDHLLLHAANVLKQPQFFRVIRV